MTEQKAIEEFNLLKETRIFIPHNNTIDIAIKALEKQIPKKYMYEELKPYGKQNLCPICNSIIQYGKVYCSECGQAIKWE